MAIGPKPSDITPLVLDTDVLNDWRFQKQGTKDAIAKYISAVKAPPALTSVTVFEALHGFEKDIAQSKDIDERTRLGMEQTRRLVDNHLVLPFNQDAAAIAAYIFPRLSKSDRSKHWADMMIAATALAHGYGGATRNRSDYELIAKHIPSSSPSLKIEVWKA